jgi:CDP-paratose 2-epimerase
MGERILITGGAGFVGSNLALRLKEHRSDCEIVAFDNLKRRGSELNLPRLKAHGIEFVHGDIRQPADLENVGPFDILLECSAEPSVLAGIHSSPRYVLDTNLTGTLNCLETARVNKAGVIFLSTSRVYPIDHLNQLNFNEGETRFNLTDDQSIEGASSAGIRENFPLEGSRSLYGATKLSSELIIQEYQSIYGMPTIINRCGVLTGPWQMGKVDQGVVVLWAARHIYQEPLSYIGYGGTGKQVRDILHVDDLAQLVSVQLDQLRALSGTTFNVGGGVDVSASLLELTAICKSLTNNSIPIDSITQDREADVRMYITDNGRVTDSLGWAPEIKVEQIMEDVVRWIRDNQESLRPILSSS